MKHFDYKAISDKDLEYEPIGNFLNRLSYRYGLYVRMRHDGWIAVLRDDGNGLGGGVLFSILILIAGLLARGYVCTVLWAWFLVPLIATPAPPMPHVIGLMLLARMVLAGYERNTTPRSVGHDVKQMISAAYFPFVVLGIGYIAKLFIG